MAAFSDTINAGADYDLSVYDKQPGGAPTDLTGCSATLQARRHISSIEADLTLTSDPAVGITLTPLDGQIDIHVSASQTAAMSGTYLVQLELHWPGGRVDRLLNGTWTVSPEVVR